MIDAHQNKIWAIVPAAGSGQRMQTPMAKQYLKINDKTILETTLKRLLGNEQIHQVVVCTAAADEIWPTLAVAKHRNIKQTRGGTSRAQTVLNGLLSLSERATDSDWILVHDAARPCLTESLLVKFIDELKHDPVGGILATPARDTLKLANADGQSIQKTLNRTLVWHAQTPQMFRFGLLLNAIKQAQNSNLKITDEASAMESAGHQVRLIAGDPRNLKVTRPEDLPLATIILRSQCS